MNKQILIKQILSLAEKQYRKGFQHGFIASQEEVLTEKQVTEFRQNGYDEGYSKVAWPLHGFRPENPLDRVEAEIIGSKELYRFLQNEEEMSFRLEYHEGKGQWHYDTGNHEENTHGWQTIAQWEPDSKLQKFTNYIDRHFIAGKMATFPKASEIKRLWELYTLK